jgi:hypothetical protein
MTKYYIEGFTGQRRTPTTAVDMGVLRSAPVIKLPLVLRLF